MQRKNRTFDFSRCLCDSVSGNTDFCGASAFGNGSLARYHFLYLCEMQNENKPLSRNLFQRFANKYTFVGLLFVIWIALFDKYSFIDRLQLRSKINQLENEQKYYREKIEEDKRKKEELLGSRDNLEKFAREQYLMKKENEDIFIIVKE